MFVAVGACSVISEVDRDKVPSDQGMGGAAAMGGSGGMAGTASGNCNNSNICD